MATRQVTVRVAAQDAFSPTLNSYNQKMAQAAQATTQVNTANRSLMGSFQGLATAVGGAIAVMGVQQIISAASEMNELGVKVSANRELFDQLTTAIGGNEAVIASLRDSTGGVVDDLTLMSGASQLLRLNIVDNNRDLSELVGNIQKLKQPTESTTDAIQNFALMLSNESLLRLDSFGISSANVKRRMDELGESFREAVMFEMGNQVERLGDAADVAETAFKRLQTRIENIVQVMAEGFAGNVEDTIAAFEGTNDLQIGRGIADRMGVNVSDFATYAEYEDFLIHAVGYQERIRDVIGETVSVFGRLVDLQRESTTQGERMAALRDMYQMSGAEFMFDTDRLQRGMFDLTNQSYGSIGETRLFTPEEAAAAQAIADNAAAMVDNLALLQPYIDGGLVPADSVDRIKEIAKEADAFAAAAQKGAEAFQNMTLGQAFGLDNGGMAGELSDKFMEAARATGMAADELERYQRALDIATGRETDFSLAVDSFIASMVEEGLPPEVVAEAQREFAETMRLAMERGMDMSAIQQAGNVPFLFGFSGGGGEGGRMIDVQPGDYLPALAQRYGGKPEDYSSLLNANGVLMPGMQQLSSGVGSFMPDQNVEGVLATFEAMKGYTNDMSTDVTATDEAMGNMVTSAELVNEGFQLVSTTLTEMFNKVYMLKLDAIAPEWVKALLLGGGIAFESALANSVTANGGNVPGTQPQGRAGSLFGPQ
jgi:hypothetical protein